MTVANAIKICDFLIEAHIRNSKGIRETVKDWTSGPHDLGITIAEVHEDVAKCILEIKKNIQPNCKHPKKMRDKTADGQFYCMNCNLDLD